MEELNAKFMLEENEEIKATFKVNFAPSRLSELENDMDFVSKDDILLPDTINLVTKDELEIALDTKQPKGDYALKSDIPNVTDFATKLELESKADDGDVVHISNEETITGAKIFTEPLTIQSGKGIGSLIIGADVNADTLNNGTRKLARVVVPTQNDNTLNTILLGFDSSGDNNLNVANNKYDNVSFGGSKKITNATSPMSILFCVASERNTKNANKKINAIEIDSNEARFNVQPNYNGKNLTTVDDVPKILLTTQEDYDSLATKEANTLYLIEEENA